jgi:hypothetical protein
MVLSIGFSSSIFRWLGILHWRLRLRRLGLFHDRLFFRRLFHWWDRLPFGTITTEDAIGYVLSRSPSIEANRRALSSPFFAAHRIPPL